MSCQDIGLGHFRSFDIHVLKLEAKIERKYILMKQSLLLCIDLEPMKKNAKIA